ncbi:hypothetical protein N7508_000160 [Penicillium antarcticum]|uniref:uncharacterized protein n=1 Tax=Penicillium antarcticum TaxID=416450 RepID=UPI00238BE3EC|nr:uncharacterized protein N7508_000160 [Penicillium antarcticum]KAJ5319877.1 hypothetical protein N7508_000160 [Penicillium antarcticum]
MTIAQSMCFHGSRSQYTVLRPDIKSYPQFICFRIAFFDRQLCLMPGMPQGPQIGVWHQTQCSPRIQPAFILKKFTASSHCEFWSETNLTRRMITPGRRARQGAAASGSEYANPVVADPEPQWPESLTGKCGGPPPSLHASRLESKLDYSRITCVNASREILPRFIMLRRRNQVAFT